MAKVVTTVRLDPDLLERIERVEEATGDNRSDVLNRAIRHGIENEENMVREMENPVTRAFYEKVGSSPALLQALAKFVGEHLSAEDIERAGKRAKEQAARGRSRQAAKRRAGRGARSEG